MKSMLELTEKAVAIAGELTYERSLVNKNIEKLTKLEGQLSLMTWIFEDEPVLLEMIERKIRLQIENNINPYTAEEEVSDKVEDLV